MSTRTETPTTRPAVDGVKGARILIVESRFYADIADALIAGGRAPGTPVAAVRWGTRPNQRTLRGTLATLAELGVFRRELEQRG